MADGAGEEEDARRPFVEYSDDKSDPDNVVLVKVDIPGLRKKKKLFGKAGVSNGNIFLDKNERSFKLKVLLSNPKQTYIYAVKKLPEDIDVDKTSYKVLRKDEVCVYLFKANPARWDAQLSSIGLETAGDD